ncbi:MAG: hypothetical protein QOH38_1136 [Thermoleophilaceae bacterium]|nr:hypothetical protein [Thermoleophilaceae bacterium]
MIAALLVALVAGGFLLGGSSGSSSGGGGATAGARAAAAKVAGIARRVETIRGLRFKRLPKPLIVTAARTRADALRELDRHSSAVERRTAAQVLELLGLLKPGIDLRAIEGDVAGEQVAGYYDTHRKRLAIVAGPGASDGVLSEITLAHELDHALDDQAIGLRDIASVGADDASSAYTALVEGVATWVMDDYARKFIDPRAALKSSLAALGASGSSTAGIPPYVLSSLLFSYVLGEKFVARLREVAHGWKLVNYALRSRPPVSTEQVIHPDKYLVDERPVRVRLPVRGMVPPGWRRVAHGTIGEFDTDQLLRLGASDGVAGDAAAGWGGGSYSLWAPAGGGAAECASPCRSRSALVVGWAWDTPADAAQFRRALPAYVVNGLDARPVAGGGSWSVGGGAVAVRARGLRTALAFAPSAALAGRLASGALGR